MKKKILMRISFVILVCGGFALLLRSAVIDDSLQSQDQLSVRTTEFLKAQKETGTSMWNEVSFETSAPRVLGTSSYSLSCFQVQLPWALVEERREDDGKTCTLTGSVATTHLRVAIHVQPFSENLTEYPGVRLRLQETKKYAREPVSVADATESMAFRDDESSVLFVRKGDRLLSLAFSGGMKKDREVSTLEKVLQTVSF